MAIQIYLTASVGGCSADTRLKAEQNEIQYRILVGYEKPIYTSKSKAQEIEVNQQQENYQCSL